LIEPAISSVLAEPIKSHRGIAAGALIEPAIAAMFAEPIWPHCGIAAEPRTATRTRTTTTARYIVRPGLWVLCAATLIFVGHTTPAGLSAAGSTGAVVTTRTGTSTSTIAIVTRPSARIHAVRVIAAVVAAVVAVVAIPPAAVHGRVVVNAPQRP
jgi:hypothetical protein